ncbi:calcium/sodium antiporter [Oceaniglobus trochenteri]|uniref:calcium/sodium antiporter n=1 Tax=Oceaniglobus trochenteri TaxID=2763260 RepID=UPI001CFF8667|nr:calcium/sodium antiporter [Oceaniglobus trochenteri]
MHDFAYVGIGLVILLLAGDSLVRGAVNLALRLGIPALIVSLTVVAFGTSAPELLISVSAILDDAPGIALGNVVGSNTANILLVLGIPAMIAAMHMAGAETRKNYLMMLAATVLFIGLCFFGPLTWWHGLIMLAALALILADQLRDALTHRRAGKKAEAEVEVEVEGADPSMRGYKIALFLAVGLVGLPLGADMLVQGATGIARDYGVSETVIGLTLVAVGTSLPELATTVMAAFRKQADVAMGNVIGSNMFNLLAIIGISTLIGPIPVTDQFLTFDLWVMLGASLLLMPFVIGHWTMGRAWGAIFAALYGGYVLLTVW